jgi:opacity protein-like surface antigen
MPAPAFEWSGFYYGLHGGGFLGQPGYNFGIHAGYNVAAGRFLYGIDVRSGGFGPPVAPLEGFVRARLGYLVTERALLFGAVGLGTAHGVLLLVEEIAAGIELAVGNRFSVRGEVDLYGDFMCGFPCGSPPFWSLGLSFHPGNGGTSPRLSPDFSWRDPYIGAVGFDLIFAVACDDQPVAAATRTVDTVEVCYLSPNRHGAGLQAGYPLGRGAFVIGPEIQIGTIFLDEPLWAAAANIRAGFVLDERLLVYAEAGFGTTLDPTHHFVTLGGGVELGVARRVSIFAEGKGVLVPDFGPDFISAMVQVGLNFHLGGG